MIESIEQDYDGKVHLAVVLDEDPGKDLGMLRQPGHRFFFSAEEVEPLRPNILVAGIGNIFLGDDGFGVEVIRRLSSREFPAEVRVEDFGIRGYDLAYALLDGPDVTILVDAAARGGAPGTIYVIEPDVTGHSCDGRPRHEPCKRPSTGEKHGAGSRPRGAGRLRARRHSAGTKGTWD